MNRREALKAIGAGLVVIPLILLWPEKARANEAICVRCKHKVLGLVFDGSNVGDCRYSIESVCLLEPCKGEKVEFDKRSKADIVFDIKQGINKVPSTLKETQSIVGRLFFDNSLDGKVMRYSCRGAMHHKKITHQWLVENNQFGQYGYPNTTYIIIRGGIRDIDFGMSAPDSGWKAYRLCKTVNPAGNCPKFEAK